VVFRYSIVVLVKVVVAPARRRRIPLNVTSLQSPRYSSSATPACVLQASADHWWRFGTRSFPKAPHQRDQGTYLPVRVPLTAPILFSRPRSLALPYTLPRISTHTVSCRLAHVRALFFLLALPGFPSWPLHVARSLAKQGAACLAMLLLSACRYCFAWTLTGLVLLFLVSSTTLGYTLYICLSRRWRRRQRRGWGRQRSDVRPVNKPLQY
jgi:hypothetical protein